MSLQILKIFLGLAPSHEIASAESDDAPVGPLFCRKLGECRQGLTVGATAIARWGFSSAAGVESMLFSMVRAVAPRCAAAA